MSPQAGFGVTAIIGCFYAVYGLFTSLHDLGIGAAVASVGVIGWDFCRWAGR